MKNILVYELHWFHPVSSGFIRFHPVLSGFIRFQPNIVGSRDVDCDSAPSFKLIIA